MIQSNPPIVNSRYSEIPPIVKNCRKTISFTSYTIPPIVNFLEPLFPIVNKFFWFQVQKYKFSPFSSIFAAGFLGNLFHFNKNTNNLCIAKLYTHFYR